MNTQTITITAKDLKKYNFTFSDSGKVIDELAYCAKQWTSNDLWENSMYYGPSEPYMYDFEDDQFREWLNGDHEHAGVVYEIAKYFTYERDGSYNQKSDEYTFTLNDEDISDAKDHGYNKNQLKAWLLPQIFSVGNARSQKDQADREKRKEECEKLAIYKKSQAEAEAQSRKEKLSAMTLK